MESSQAWNHHSGARLGGKMKSGLPSGDSIGFGHEHSHLSLLHHSTRIPR
jgi:hypothetical protein